MKPKVEPAGNLKRKFAGWLALASRSLGVQLPLPPRKLSILASIASAITLPFFSFSLRLSPSLPVFTTWIPPKTRLPLTIMMISKQSLRMSRISLRQHSSSALSLPSGKTPVVRGARACTVCRAAKVCISAYPIPKLVSHHHHVDEMCWCGRRLSTLSTLQAHRCRVCACQTSFLPFFSLA